MNREFGFIKKISCQYEKNKHDFFKKLLLFVLYGDILYLSISGAQ